MVTEAERPLRGLYAITDPERTPGENLLDACASALRGGAVLLQYRDKPAGPALRQERAARLRELCDHHGARLIINDDIELARRVGADGVHLGQSDGDPAAARARLGDRALIGVSCHGDPALARNAAARGVDYVALGRFFPSRTKPQAPPAGLETLRALRAELDLPLVAIGGVNPDNAPQLIEAGADLVAVIHDLFAAPDIEARARRFAELFEETP
jgi:thiamine-phosphate pyrophosphorylase